MNSKDAPAILDKYVNRYFLRFIKRGLKFYHILVLHIPTVESYRKTLPDRS